MNERIKELAKQAGARTQSWCACHDYPYFQLLDEDIEKFAKLIIQECVEICDKDYVRCGQAGAGWRLARDIEEHFGVEE